MDCRAHSIPGAAISNDWHVMFDIWKKLEDAFPTAAMYDSGFPEPEPASSTLWKALGVWTMEGICRLVLKTHSRPRPWHRVHGENPLHLLLRFLQPSQDAAALNLFADFRALWSILVVTSPAVRLDVMLKAKGMNVVQAGCSSLYVMMS
jgi:hypothetical protein